VRARITIGDFSRATHLSIKTLRHYHDVGLLEPSDVDPGSGYRYYSEDQIATAQVIRRLRGLQMPVAEVKSVLAAPDSEARNRLITVHLDRLEADLASTAAAVAELRALTAQPQEPDDVEHRTELPQPAIAIHETVDREDLLDWWQGALGELRAIALAQSLEPAGMPGGLYSSSLFQHGRGQATVFIPTDATSRAVGRVERFTVPATELAIMVHHGSLASADLTYGRLGAHVIRHEISVEGPLRENYLVGILDTEDPTSWETEIGWPIFRSDSETR
jgi:DNA-binding transcriptional MerR regulator/effector-binding domain-containing protein